MSGFELLSDQGLRLDGRRRGELRRISSKIGVFGQADGSAYFEQVRVDNLETQQMFDGCDCACLSMWSPGIYW